MKIDFAKLYEMDVAMKQDALHLEAVQEIEDPGAILRGEYGHYDLPIRLYRFKGRRAYDVVGTTEGALILISNKFRDVLLDGGITGWDTYPIELVDGDYVQSDDQYWGLSVTGKCGPIDYSRSARVRSPAAIPGGEEQPALRGLYFRESSWDGSDIFCPADSYFIVVVQRVRDLLLRRGMTNVQFTALSEFELLDVRRE